eukprot:9083710-Ditylum_brightwellii.AAC.1
MMVKRSTLRICVDSVLERQFDDSKWTNQYPDKISIKNWSCEEVANWAKTHAEIPAEVALIFEETGVNGLELIALGREELEDLGIQEPGELSTVTKAINVLRAKDQNKTIFIDHNPYCFGKIIDQLRVKAMCREEYMAL